MKLPTLKYLSITLLFLIFVASCSSTKETTEQAQLTPWLNLDTVKAGKFDTGKMWTFEHAPLDYFENTYGFKPDEDWLTKTRLSTLRFSTGCTASFISEDGLIMTNHHCIDMVAQSIQKEGENIFKDGFIAEKLEDERKVPDVYVDQLILIKDVTDDIINISVDDSDALAITKATEKKIAAIEKEYSDETGLVCKVTPLYNGGKYSLYGYRRYTDVRAVFFAESEIGLYGGDPDNFTYPRYNLDCAFLRVYEDDKPLKTENYFPFSDNGVVEGEPLFIVGNPGSTKRLKTVAQLEYLREYYYKNISTKLLGLQEILEEEMRLHPEKAAALQNPFILVSNSAKVYSNELKGMWDPYLMARKKAFETNFKNDVMADENLKIKYGHIWDAIKNNREELKKYADEIFAYGQNSFTSSKYFLMAQKLVRLASQLNLPEEKRKPKYQSENLQNTIDKIFPADFDESIERKKLALQADIISMHLGSEHELVKNTFNGAEGKMAADYALSNSEITSAEKVSMLIEKGSQAILNSSDPFIKYIIATSKKLREYRKIEKEINATEEVLEAELGRALFSVYGTSVPPDATFTLRITDCVMKDYQYNGTVAPKFTTFYGLYEKYYSHENEYPWDISERWKNPSPDFDMSTMFNFIATCDITGGSSGSPVINQYGEVVGVAFDGNIESIPANFIFTTEKNRTVSVASQGMIEAIDKVYKFKRLSKEILNKAILANDEIGIQ